MTGTIYFIEFVVRDEDSRHYEVDYAAPDSDYGYFTDKESAEAVLADLNERERGRYNSAYGEKIAKNEQKREAYEVALRHWRILKDAGEQVEKPRKPYLTHVPSFEGFLSSESTFYRIGSLEPAKTKEQTS